MFSKTIKKKLIYERLAVIISISLILTSTTQSIVQNIFIRVQSTYVTYQNAL